MCINERHRYTNKRYINLNTMFRTTTTFGCGVCHECLEAKINEYKYRVDAEYSDCIAHGGFVYWDTLTYDEEHVPCFYDNAMHVGVPEDEDIDFFRCFNREDIKKFFKRLRINIRRAGYEEYRFDERIGKEVSNLKYFLTSEYGEKFHRPHYHFIVFCQIPNMTPEILDSFIRDSWDLGRLDEKHTTEEKVLTSVAACRYVSKYVVKPQNYLKRINEYMINHPETLQSMIVDFKPFHRQSNYLGISLAFNQDYETMFKHDRMKYVEFKKGTKYVPIPMYIKRKLWYKCVKFSDGKYHWLLTEEGLAHKRELLQHQVVKMQDNIAGILDYMESKQVDTSTLREKLEGRSWQDYAHYILLYKGRYIPQFYDYAPTTPPSITAMIDDMSELIVNPDHDKRYWKAYNDDTIVNCTPWCDTDSLSHIVNHCSINQDTFFEFRYFDEMKAVFDYYRAEQSKVKAKEYQEKKELERRLSTLKF